MTDVERELEWFTTENHLKMWDIDVTSIVLKTKWLSLPCRLFSIFVNIFRLPQRNSLMMKK